MKKQVISFLMSTTWLLISNLVPAGAITTSGQIKGEETWSGAVHLIGDVTVTATGKLTILAGTTIDCEPNSDDTVSGADTLRTEIIVNGGALIAKGSADQRIVFTSSAAEKDSGDWYGLRFIGASVSTVVQYCIVQYGVNGISVERGVISSIEQWIVEQSSENGVSFVSGGTLTACTIRNNGKYGVWFGQTGRLSQCTVSGNGDDGVHGNKSFTTVIDGQTLIEGNTGDGFEGGSITARDSKFLSNKGYGVNVSSKPTSVVVFECIMNSNKKAGFYVNGYGINDCNVSISNTTASGNEEEGLYVWANSPEWGSHSDGWELMFKGNTIENNGESGLHVSGNSGSYTSSNNWKLTVYDNAFNGNTLSGVQLSGNGTRSNWNVSLSRNILNSNGDNAILIYSKAGSSDNWNVSITGNKEIKNNGNNGLSFRYEIDEWQHVIWNNWSVEVRDNQLSINGGDAIGMSGTLAGSTSISKANWKVIISGNTLQNHGGYGVNLPGDGTWKADIADNTIQVSGRSGIYVSGADSLSINRNALIDNTEAGIWLVNVPDTVAVSLNTVSGASIYGVRINTTAKDVQEVTGIENNNFENDGLYVFDNESSAKIIAPNNYWGPAATQEMNGGKQNISLIYDSHDKSGLGEVVFNPYLQGGGLTAGILGDVNNSRTVNIADALIVASYDLDHTISIPNNGNIQLGDVNRDNAIKITDALIIATYDVDPANPNLPAGIGQPVGASKPAVVNKKLYEASPETAVTANLAFSDTAPAPGETIDVAVTLDMTGTEKLGAYSATLTWEPSALTYEGYSGGGEGFDKPSVRSEDGKLTFNQFDVEGAGGSVHIITASFRVKGEITSEPLHLEFSSLTAASTFNNLLPYLSVNDQQDVQLRSTGSVPTVFSLSQNYPNPFNGATTIAYALPVSCMVNMTVYNINGQVIRTLVDGENGAGYHTVVWDGKNDAGKEVASGFYFYRLKTNAFVRIRKMVFVQ